MTTLNSPPYSYFWFVTKIVVFKIAHLLRIYQQTTFHVPTLTDANVVSTLEV